MEKWTHPEGNKPYSVTVKEREPGGMIYLHVWSNGKEHRRSLGHRDRDRAVKEAAAAAASREEAGLLRRRGFVREAALVESKVLGREADQWPLHEVLAEYLREHSPEKSDREQQADRRRAQMWARVLGPKSDPHDVDRRQWKWFIKARRAGAIDARGRPRAADKRRSVGDRTIQADCIWSGGVFAWAVSWDLMDKNPVIGFDTPSEENPSRPVASHDRYEAIRAITDDVDPDLTALFDIVAETGHRLTPVCQLRYSDLRLDRFEYGAVVWPADTDKQGRERAAPLSEAARAAIDRVLRRRPVIGDAYLFPSPRRSGKPITRHLADKWLRKAEKLAGVAPLRGTLWHAYRRKWVTERKDLSDTDTAAAGGWASVATMQASYQHPDSETMFYVVTNPRRVREGGLTQ